MLMGPASVRPSYNSVTCRDLGNILLQASPWPGVVTDPVGGFITEPAASNLLMQVGQFRCGTRALAVSLFWISLDSVLPFLSEIYTK